VSGLHERLVADLDEFDRLLVHKIRPVNALRAVVELHAPRPCSRGSELCFHSDEHFKCTLCGSAWDVGAVGEAWPCSTIRTIAEALGVTTEGDDRG
jgi:hypothetical protein